MRVADIIGRTPFLRITIPFLLGIAAGECGLLLPFNMFWFVAVIACLYGCLLIFYARAISFRFRWIWGLLAFLFLFFSGLLLWQQQKYASELPLHKSIFIDATVVENPVQKTKTVQFRVEIEGYKCENSWCRSKENVVLYLHPSDGDKRIPKAGDRILAKVFLEPIKPPSNPEEFDYRKYMQRRGYYATSFIKSNAYEVVGENVLPFYKSIPLKIQQGLLSMFSNAGIDGQELAVLMALTIGDKQLLEDDVRKAYSLAGVVHILAVSGLHVGLLYLQLTGLLFFLKGSRGKLLLKAMIILLCLWMYAAIADFSPSVVRAATMFSFMLFAQLLGRQPSTLNAVFASAFFICLIKPLSLFDVGFQLSYLAVLGILAFYPKLKMLLKIKNPILNGVWKICCVSFAAQLAVLPLSVFYFHQLSSYFLLANILVLPLVAVSVYLIVLLLVVFYIPVLPTHIGWLLSKCIWLINYIVEAIHQLPFSTVDRIYLSPFQLLLCLFAVGLLMCLMFYRKKSLLWLAIGCFITSLSIGFANYVRTGKQNQLVVFDVKYASCITFIGGHSAVCIKDSKSDVMSLKYKTNGYFIKHGIVNENIQVVQFSDINTASFPEYLPYYKGFFLFGGKSVKVLGAIADSYYPKNPFPVEVLVVTKGYKQSIHETLLVYSPRLVVLDSSVSSQVAQEWSAVLKEKCIMCHNVKNNGALVLDW